MLFFSPALPFIWRCYCSESVSLSSSVVAVHLLVQILVFRVVLSLRKAMGCVPIALADSSLALIVGRWRDGMHMIISKHLLMVVLRHVSQTHTHICLPHTLRCDGGGGWPAPLSPAALPEQATCWLSQV